MSQQQPYIFYSERDSNSKQVIETIKGLNKGGLFKFIQVETLDRKQFPPWLTKVPTLYVPATKEVVVGKDIYGFIAKPTNSRKEVPAKSDAGVSAPNQFGDLTAWGFEGQGMIGESYSLWDTPTQFVNQEGTSRYTFLDGSSGAPTPGGVPSSGGPTSKNTLDDKTKSATNADVMARMEQMNNQRNNEFGGITRK
jgi:hypothetical protein